MLRLSALFSLDAFAGGLITQSLMAYWFAVRWGAEPAVLGAIFFGANILAAISSLSAARLAARFGLINTMVFTHLPSNVLLILVPLMPNLPLAVLVLLARFSISQMDVPTRQSYTMAVVEPDERSAAAGVTGIARTTGAAVSPIIAAPLFGVAALAAVPFLLSGGLKIASDARGGGWHHLAVRRRSGAAPAGSTEAEPDERDDREDDEHDHRQVERLKGLADVHPMRAELRSGKDEGSRPNERAGGRIGDEPQERHPGDAGREADECPDDRHEAGKKRSRRTVLFEEPLGGGELVRPDQQVPAPPLEERSPAVRADRVADQ